MTIVGVPSLAIAILFGLVLGVFSAVGDAVHVTVVNGLANAAGPWILTAFFCGVLQRPVRRGAIAGAMALGVAVAAYYGWLLVGGHDFPVQFLVAWVAAAAATGAVFGASGSIRMSALDPWRTGAVVLVSGALLSEAAYRLLLLEVWTGVDWGRTYMQVALADALAAVLLLLVLVERRTWLAAFAAVPVVTGVGILLFFMADAVFRRVLENRIA